MKQLKKWFRQHPELEDSTEAARIWDAIQSCPRYSPIAVGDWSIEEWDVFERAELLEHYRCGTNPAPRVQMLPELLAQTATCCVITIRNRDRSGLEHYPKSVLGRSASFFVDAETFEVKHIIEGIYVS